MHRYSSAQRRVFRTLHRLTYTRPSVPYTLLRVQRSLIGYGFPCGWADGKWGPKTSAAVRRFQEAYNGGEKGGEWLIVDGELGPLTKAALRGLPYLSPHFQASECWSKGNGDCYVQRDLLVALEKEREDLGRPLKLISCYRDPAHNVKVGGAKFSRHLYGEAADISHRNKLMLPAVKAKRRYGGIGVVSRGMPRCVHLDVRPGNVDRPRVWYYQ